MIDVPDPCGDLENLVFSTTDCGAVASLLRSHFVDALGAEPVATLLYQRGTGIVCGAELADGRSAVVKVHRPDLRPAGLDAVVAVQTFAHARGLAVPKPLTPPLALANGLATTEEFVTQARPNDTRSPTLRRALADELARFIDTCRALVPVPNGLHRALNIAGNSLWPTPHDLAFDFGSTGAGAGWIDDAGAAARRFLRSSHLPLVIGHCDWRPDNLSIVREAVACIYDWDSVATASEAEFVGTAAGSFFTVFGLEDDPLPTLSESRAFVGDYEHAIGRAFSDQEWRVIAAAHIYHAAYGARCQHSREQLAGVDRRDHQWKRLLSEALANPLRDVT